MSAYFTHNYLYHAFLKLNYKICIKEENVGLDFPKIFFSYLQ